MADFLRNDADRLRLVWRLGLWLLLFVGLVLLLGFPLAGLEPTTPAAVATGGAVTLVAAGLAGWLLLRLDGRPFSALGFHGGPEAPREAGLGLLLGLAVAIAVVAVQAALGAVRWSPEAGSVPAWLTTGAVSFAVLLLPAAAEEAVFRGYPLQALAEAWGSGPALLLTSGAFALLHWTNPSVSAIGLAGIAGAGLFLGALYLRTGSLWWATGAHLGWNWALAFWVDLPVSGLELADTPYWEGVPRGAEWLSGGAFGPEGSVVGAAGFLLAGHLAWRSGFFRPGRTVRRADPLTPLPGADR